MHQMTHVEHSYHKNMMDPNSQEHSYLTPSLKHEGSGAPQNRKPTEYIMLLPNGITTSKDLVCNDHKPLAKFLN